MHKSSCWGCGWTGGPELLLRRSARDDKALPSRESRERQGADKRAHTCSVTEYSGRRTHPHTRDGGIERCRELKHDTLDWENEMAGGLVWTRNPAHPAS